MDYTSVVPSQRQKRLQALEFYGFLHFGVNTFTDREWGDGSECPAIFAPERLDVRQWVRALKAAGMRGAILTCKHHDGFCLWPSRYTDHSVKASPFGGDLVREVSDACRAEGLAFGVYLSPWDRHEKTYGQGEAYDDFYVNQLTELLTGYGELFAVWLDGACGEGPNGKRQMYDWARYERTVRALQPDACLCVCGPDVRWCGNESGETRLSEWSVVPARLKDAERVSAQSQRADGTAFRERKIRSTDLDLGSREALTGEEDLIWYPAEVDVSIRPGWFHHPAEDGLVKSADELYEIYLRSVGGNATLLLSVPPTKEGLIHPADEAALAALGKIIRRTFAEPLFEAPGGETIDIRLPAPERLGMLRLKEDIRFSQRVEAFEAELSLHGSPVSTLKGTTVGYQRLLPLDGALADHVRVRVTESRGEPIFSMIGLYRAQG
jgi:alpha-L-fucosidase